MRVEASRLDQEKGITPDDLGGFKASVSDILVYQE
jgi:hypothetical protein